MEKFERKLLIWTLIFLAIAFAWNFFLGVSTTAWWILNPMVMLYRIIMSFLYPPLSTIWIIGILVIFYRELKRRKREEKEEECMANAI